MTKSILLQGLVVAEELLVHHGQKLAMVKPVVVSQKTQTPILPMAAAGEQVLVLHGLLLQAVLARSHHQKSTHPPNLNPIKTVVETVPVDPAGVLVAVVVLAATVWRALLVLLEVPVPEVATAALAEQCLWAKQANLTHWPVAVVVLLDIISVAHMPAKGKQVAVMEPLVAVQKLNLKKHSYIQFGFLVE
jgi:hypothetical protein